MFQRNAHTLRKSLKILRAKYSSVMFEFGSVCGSVFSTWEVVLDDCVSGLGVAVSFLYCTSVDILKLRRVIDVDC